MVQSRSEKTKRRVLAATGELIIEKGLYDVTLKDIEARSGVSNGSIFHHFGNKDGVFAQIFAQERLDYLVSVADAIIAFDGEDPCDAFGAGARAALQWQCDHPDRFSRLIAQFNNSQWMVEHEHVWIELAHQIEQPVIDWARPHFEARRLPLLPATFFQSFMTGATERLTHGWLTHRLDRPSVEFADEAAMMVAEGLKALRRHQYGDAAGH
ncbi:TetR/AcrR family transcriptional regulator [Sphingomicrobium flavum]|uniref:TetR/AcrR family transcriptional regulator n=1 Tax=Sphingomicrobium flavum TaxID=1229164 RepID=UPI0021AE1B63|nr:TetR/AcrR family transcriptional regulator [Sphingomicrobium flavum]